MAFWLSLKGGGCAVHKAAKLYALLGVLAILCVCVFAVSQHQEKKEQIKTMGTAILEIPTEDVTNVTWVNDEGSFSFSKADTWTYDDDEAFPVDSAAIESLLFQFQSFRAAFSIENVEDFAQYGLDAPCGSISVTASGQTYTLELGDYSKMDQQRYLTLGDGTVYLAEHDPLDEFSAVAQDMILNDSLPAFDTAEEITFTGAESCTVTRNEEEKSLCASDVYFTDGKPLDTSLVSSYLTTLKGVSLTNFVTYNATADELTAYGMDNPMLTVEVRYSGDTTGSFQLHLSQDVKELEAYQKAEEEGTTLPTVTCYARLGDSQIVYEIPQSTYQTLTAASYNDLRHQKVFTGEFSTVTAMDVTLDGQEYSFICQEAEEKDAESTWLYNGTEFAVYSLRTALCSMSASAFTGDEPTGQEEISVTLHLDNEDFPTFTLTLYRHNGSTCLASVDGSPIAYVQRTQAVDLIEAVNQVILGS